MDIVFPQKNEKEFIQIAEKLKTKQLFLIYPYKTDIWDYKTIIQKLQKNTRINLKLGLIAAEKDILKAKKLCNFVITQSTEKDQHTLEKLRPSLIYNLESSERRDKFHYKLSGLNQVLCNLAHKNNIIIGFSFSTLLNSKKRQVLLGRIIQNLKLCKKYKVKTLLASFAKKPFEMRSEKDLKSLKNILN